MNGGDDISTELGGRIDTGAIAAATGATVVSRTTTLAATVTGAAVHAKTDKDLTNILTADDLVTLRKNYQRAAFLSAAPKMIRYWKAGGFVDWLGNTVFNPVLEQQPTASDPDPAINYYKDRESSDLAEQTTLTPGHREAVVLSVMATTQRDPFTMSAHIYWALMEGLSVENVADIFMTAGAYAGIDNFRFTSSLLADLLTMLNEFMKQGKTATGQVLFRLNAVYGVDAKAKGLAAALLPDPPTAPPAVRTT